MKRSWYELRLTMPGRPPFRQVFAGLDLDDALAGATRRFPYAEIDVPEQAAKVSLARSSNGPKTTKTKIKTIVRCLKSTQPGSES